ncbi:GEVED domain-containing protein [Soonwooa sp.]|uniref:GEVED domain-containing protein n=1 Tax=Soonwooa sp. TaxID=1938592 RepID=UPI0026141918|nr:GEVED domain-containing protein [Soonwooa sp.]
MKKILLSSVLALGIIANAQVHPSTNLRTETKNASEFPYYDITGKLNAANAKNDLNNQTSNTSVGESNTSNLLSPPGCANLFSPPNNSIGSVYDPIVFTWNPPLGGGATTYDLYIGLDPGGMILLGPSTVTGGYVGGTTPDTKYYWKVIAKNADGSAINCETWSFTTMPSLEPYCGPIYRYEVEPITYVNFKFNTAKTSSDNTTFQHENFITNTFKVEKGGTTTISVNSNTGGAAKKHYYTVFVDWNQNGNFNDAGEVYYATAPYFSNLGSDGVDAAKIVTMDMVVPENAVLGKTRMRIKAINGPTNAPTTANLNNMKNPCANTGDAAGQAEDYTIEVVPKGSLAVNDISKSNLSVYPNPFKDVVKISDIKDMTGIVVTDLSGRTVISSKPSTDLNLSQLKKGVYIINFNYSNGETKSTKVIKD